MEEQGNTLAYALGSLTRLLEKDVGWEAVGPDVIERVRAHPITSPSIHSGAWNLLHTQPRNVVLDPLAFSNKAW